MVPDMGSTSATPMHKGWMLNRVLSSACGIQYLYEETVLFTALDWPLEFTPDGQPQPLYFSLTPSPAVTRLRTTIFSSTDYASDAPALVLRRKGL